MSHPHNNTILACAYSLSVHPDTLAAFIKIMQAHSKDKAEGLNPSDLQASWTTTPNTLNLMPQESNNHE